MPYTLKFGYLLEIRTRIGLLKSRTWLTWSKAFSACHIDSTATRYKVWLVTLLQSPLSLSPSISSLESAFHFRLKTPLFQKSFPLFVFLVPFGLLWTWTGLSGHWRLFVIISSFSLYFFYISVLVTCARLSWPHFSVYTLDSSSKVPYIALPTDRIVCHSTHTQHIRRQELRCRRPRVWNSLPAHLRDEDISYNSFRRELKTFLF